MQDILNLMVLVCAAIAALGLGVLLAFAVCRAGFTMMRLQARQVGTSHPAAPIGEQQVAEV